jgi:hypothetical protein
VDVGRIFVRHGVGYFSLYDLNRVIQLRVGIPCLVQ